MRNRNCFLVGALFYCTLMLCAVQAGAGYINDWTYEDTVVFDPNWLYSGVADWWHDIPSDFDPVSATITLELRVSNYSEVGALDLFCSNTDVFDYGSPYTASSKPGYIARLYFLVPPIFVDPSLQTVSLPLKVEQLPWLGDDGNLHVALIGNQYIFPTGYPARFYLTSSTLTASAVPVPGAVWLLGSGLVGLLALKRRRKG